MKNETLVFLGLAVIVVWLYLNRKKRHIPLTTSLNPPGSSGHTSTPSSGAGGSDLSNGFIIETHGDPLPIRHGIPLPKPPLSAGKNPVSKTPYMKGNFQNSTAGYSRKIGQPTNNVRLLPGKVNSGNRQGLRVGRVL